MKPTKGYEEAKTITDKEKLPKGGYVIEILDVEEIGKKGETNYLKFSFDIAEGEHKGFYEKDYNSQNTEDQKWRGIYNLFIAKEDGSEMDNWTLTKFKTAITSIENSNKGYHWDWEEKDLKGKIVGAVFVDKEWEMNGRTGFATACVGFRNVEAIRTGNFKQPDDIFLNGASAGNKDEANTKDWADNDEGGNLPF